MISNRHQLPCTKPAGWQVGLRCRDADHLELWLGHLLLGEIEISNARFLQED